MTRIIPNNQITLLQGRVEYRLLHYASHALYGSFLDAGIEIYEYHKSMMHDKVAVIDGHWATVGSSNLDPFSLLLALEANVVIDKFYSKSIQKAILEREPGRQGVGGADTVMSQAAQSTGHYRQAADCDGRGS